MLQVHPEIREIRVVYSEQDANDLLSEGWIFLDEAIHDGITTFIFGFDEDYAEILCEEDEDDPLTPLSDRYEGTL